MSDPIHISKLVPGDTFAFASNPAAHYTVERCGWEGQFFLVHSGGRLDWATYDPPDTHRLLLVRGATP